MLNCFVHVAFALLILYIPTVLYLEMVDPILLVIQCHCCVYLRHASYITLVSSMIYCNDNLYCYLLFSFNCFYFVSLVFHYLLCSPKVI